MPSKLLNIKQVEDLLQLSERTIFRLIKKGDLKGFKAGREWRFEESDIDAYIQAQKAKTAVPVNTQEVESDWWKPA